MSGEIVKVNNVSMPMTASALGLGGMRRLHVVRIGEPVDLDRWLAMVPAQSRSSLARTAWQEGTSIIRHYLVMVWPCREKIRLPGVYLGGDQTVAVDAVMWKARSEDKTSGQMIIVAAETYWAEFDRWPATALVGNDVSDPLENLSLGEGRPGLAVRVMGWVPKRCAVVY